MVSMEGRLQRLTVGVATTDGVRTPLTWLTGLARRRKLRLPNSAASVFTRLVEAAPAGRFPVAGHGDISPQGVLGVTGGAAAAHKAPTTAPSVSDGQLVLHVAPYLYDAADVAHTPAMSFLRDETKVVVNRADARALGLRMGSRTKLTVSGQQLDVTIVTSSRIAPGHARTHAGTPGFAPGRVGFHAATLAAAAPDATPTAAAAGGAQEAEV
jgi:hypothetical protein